MIFIKEGSEFYQPRVILQHNFMKPSAEMMDLLEKGSDFEHFLNTHINGVLAIQEDGSLLSADHNVASLLGYNPAQLPGMSIQSILPGLELPAPGQGEPLQGQAVALRKDKKEISVSYTIRQGKEEEGRLIHYLLLHRESSIAQSLELYTHMFEWMPVGILVYNL